MPISSSNNYAEMRIDAWSSQMSIISTYVYVYSKYGLFRSLIKQIVNQIID